MIPIGIIKRLIRKYRIDTDNYSETYIQHAATTELEHRDIIGNNPELALRIAIAHIKEYPSYYIELQKMEAELARTWRNRQKPDLFY